MADLAELLERVKAATGPDQELDRDVVEAMDQEFHGGRMWLPEPLPSHSGRWVPGNVTASLDAALTLVERALPDARVLMGLRQTPDTMPWARVGKWLTCDGADATGATLPIALLAALLSALAMQKSVGTSQLTKG